MREETVGAGSVVKVVAALAAALALGLPSYAAADPVAKVDSGQPVRAELLQFRITTHLWQGGNQPFYESSSSFPSGRIVFPGHLMRSGKLTLETAGRKFALQRVEP